MEDLTWVFILNVTKCVCARCMFACVCVAIGGLVSEKGWVGGLIQNFCLLYSVTYNSTVWLIVALACLIFKNTRSKCTVHSFHILKTLMKNSSKITATIT